MVVSLRHIERLSLPQHANSPRERNFLVAGEQIFDPIGNYRKHGHCHQQFSTDEITETDPSPKVIRTVFPIGLCESVHGHLR
jgi:hypothetical protein